MIHHRNGFHGLRRRCIEPAGTCGAPSRAHSQSEANAALSRPPSSRSSGYTHGATLRGLFSFPCGIWESEYYDFRRQYRNQPVRTGGLHPWSELSMHAKRLVRFAQGRVDFTDRVSRPPPAQPRRAHRASGAGSSNALALVAGLNGCPGMDTTADHQVCQSQSTRSFLASHFEARSTISNPCPSRMI